MRNDTVHSKAHLVTEMGADTICLFQIKIRILWPFFLQQEGRYEYKYIVDGEWTINKHELVTTQNKDGHVNNYVQVSKSSPDFVLLSSFSFAWGRWEKGAVP